jgi:hypothetical protein
MHTLGALQLPQVLADDHGRVSIRVCGSLHCSGKRDAPNTSIEVSDVVSEVAGKRVHSVEEVLAALDSHNTGSGKELVPCTVLRAPRP